MPHPGRLPAALRNAGRAGTGPGEVGDVRAQYSSAGPHLYGWSAIRAPRGARAFRCAQALLDHPDVDAAFAVFPDHKNFWTESGCGFSRLNPLQDAPRQVKSPILREDTGVACATRFQVAREHGRLGAKNIPIVHDDGFSFIDIHNMEDLWLAEQVVQRCKGTGRYDF